MGNEKPEDPNPDLNPDPNQRPEPSSAAVPLETKRGNRKRMPVAPAAVATNPSWFTPKRLTALTVFGKDMKVLLLEKVYVVNVLGYIAYNFVIGAYSYWGPKAGAMLTICLESYSSLWHIGLTSSGFVLDRMTSTIPNAFKLLSLATLVGGVFCFAAFCFKSLYAFLAFFAIGELLVFATQAPVNFVCLHCVKPSLRPLSMAISTVSIHIFGDVPSSPLVGLLQDHINNWRVTALILTSILFVSAGLWFIGVFLNSVDRYNEDNEHPATAVEKSNSTPLLAEKTA
ncbi:putative sphingolipid transporter spinster2 [Sesamum angolense]|uniref:Sphingolipid transporter spinster2 n=1 Tax=Sesamum angolense TaxID=2727404 RepID=A0AAE1T3H3_9LAMI|nr:putative sphingolipid transporter spinster2 [Sesamum angolense]